MSDPEPGFTPSLEAVDCAPLPDDFVNWWLNPLGWDKGDANHDDVRSAIDAIVSSPSGQWAAFAISALNDSAVPPIRYYAYISPIPLAPQEEVIGVARVRADTGETIWSFDNYTSWRGDQQQLGVDAVNAAFD